MRWNTLEEPSQIALIREESFEQPICIFKHSTRCSISSMAKFRLEGDWDFSEDKLKPYLLNVIQNRNLSLQIADDFQVHHESPQLLLIRDGECTYEESHLDISVEELHECYDSKF